MPYIHNVTYINNITQHTYIHNIHNIHTDIHTHMPDIQNRHPYITHLQQDVKTYTTDIHTCKPAHACITNITLHYAT